MLIELLIAAHDAIVSRVEQAEEQRVAEHDAEAVYGLADVRPDAGAQLIQSTHFHLFWRSVHFVTQQLRGFDLSASKLSWSLVR